MPATLSLEPPPKAAKDEEAVRGWHNVPLDRTGTSNAHSIGKALKGRGIGIFICSDLPRALETCEILSKEAGIPIAGTTPLLRTWDPGELEGSGLKDSKKIIQWYVNHPFEKPKGGESINDFKWRSLPKMAQIMEVSINSGVIVGVVTHHWVVDLTYHWIQSGTPADLNFKMDGLFWESEDPPGSVYDMRLKNGKWSMPLVPPGINFHPGPVVIRHEQTSQN